MAQSAGTTHRIHRLAAVVGIAETRLKHNIVDSKPQAFCQPS
jgi:hypothetical protein